jgi:hypothetical protein
MTESFNESELGKCEWQYQVVHQTTEKFKSGELVFLKSNPECPMKVLLINPKEVLCIPVNGKNIYNFPPQCLLQYRYAGLETDGKGNGFKISLN